MIATPMEMSEIAKSHRFIFYLGDEEILTLRKIKFSNYDTYSFTVQFYWCDLLDIDYIFSGKYSTAKIWVTDGKGEPFSVVKLSGVTPEGPVIDSFNFDYSKTDRVDLSIVFKYQGIEVTSANL